MRYGGVQLDATGRVTGFVRRGPAAEGSYHYIGVQVVDRPGLRSTSSRATPASSIGGVYDALIAAQPGAVRGVVCGRGVLDVGTPADYWRTSLAFAAAADRSSAPESTRESTPSAHVTRSILWDDVEVGADVQLDDASSPTASSSRRGAALPPGDPRARRERQPIVLALDLTVDAEP